MAYTNDSAASVVGEHKGFVAYLRNSLPKLHVYTVYVTNKALFQRI